MYSQVSNHSSESENSPSHGTMKSLVGMVEAALLAQIEAQRAPLDRISVQVLGLSSRANNALERGNIDTIQRLINCTDNNLLTIRNIGITTLEEIRNKLYSYIHKMLRKADWKSQVVETSSRIIQPALLAQLELQGVSLDRIGVEVLALSRRAYNALKRTNIDTIQQLANCTESNLLSIRNIGVTTLDDMRNKLNSYIDTALRTGGWDSQREHTKAICEKLSQLTHTSANTESSSSPPLEQVRTPLTLDEAFNELFGILKNPRQSMILRLRYGLDDGMPRTLEEVGQRFGITRERIRQIENKILNRIRHPTRRHIIDDIVRPFEFALQQAGGILKENQISEKVTEVMVLSEINPIGATRFVLKVTSRLEEIGDGIWALEECPHEYFPSVTAAAALRLEKNHSRMRYNQLVSEVRKILDPSNSMEERKIDTLFIEACLQVDAQFEISNDGWCTLAKWQNSYIDEMVEVLRNEDTPLHFREIASGVKALLNGNHEVSDHNIHAIAQRRQDIFVWVGQGTYGLVEWGMQRPLYYVDLINNILEVEGKALPAEEIIRRVEESRPCKHTSIMMYLTLNDRFAEFAPGIYGLSKWLSMKSGHTSELPDSFINELKGRLASSLPGNKAAEKGSAEEVSQMADFNPAEMDKAAEEAKAELSQMLKDLEGDDAGLKAMLGVFNWWHKHYLKAGHRRLGRIVASLYKTLAE